MTIQSNGRIRRAEELLPDVLSRLHEAAADAEGRLERLERHRAALLADGEASSNGSRASNAEALTAQAAAVRAEVARLTRAAESTRAFIERRRNGGPDGAAG